MEVLPFLSESPHPWINLCGRADYEAKHDKVYAYQCDAQPCRKKAHTILSETCCLVYRLHAFDKLLWRGYQVVLPELEDERASTSNFAAGPGLRDNSLTVSVILSIGFIKHEMRAPSRSDPQ